MVIKESWRCALGYLYSMNMDPGEFLPEINPASIEFVAQALSVGIK